MDIERGLTDISDPSFQLLDSFSDSAAKFHSLGIVPNNVSPKFSICEGRRLLEDDAWEPWPFRDPDPYINQFVPWKVNNYFFKFYLLLRFVEDAAELQLRFSCKGNIGAFCL